MEVYIKGGHGYDCYDCYDTYIMLCSAIIAVYSKGVFPDVVDEVTRRRDRVTAEEYVRRRHLESGGNLQA